MIIFHLDQRSGVPTYLQLVQQVRQAVRLGILRPGDQLPTVKEVVGTLAINPNTVLKAYRELDHEGLVAARRGVGTFVADELPSRAARRPEGAAGVAAALGRAGAGRRPRRREHRGAASPTRRAAASESEGRVTVPRSAPSGLGKRYGSRGRCATARSRFRPAR